METISDLYPIQISRQGFSHKKAEEEFASEGRKFPCQDRSYSGVLEAGTLSLCVSSVSDGHGSAPHFRSGEGAQAAVETMRERISAHAEKIASLASRSEIDAELRAMTGEICAEWRKRVLEDAAKNPPTETELKYLSEDAGGKSYLEKYRRGEELENIYGCTALSFAYVPEKKFWFAIQIGDGDIVFKKKGGVDYEKPIPDDDSAVGSETFSMCDSNAAELFKWNFGLNEEVSAAFCSSDGIFNSYNSDKGLFNFYNTIIEEFCYSDRGDEENENIPLRVENLQKELKKYLDDLSRKASHDDMSVSGIVEITSERILGHKNSGSLIEQGKKSLQTAINSASPTVRRINFDSAIKKFQEAAKNGFPEGYMYGGVALLRRAEAEGRDERSTAEMLFQRAINGGCLEAKKHLGRSQCHEGILKLSEKKYAEALDKFSKSAENDIPAANFWLSKIYKNPQKFGNCVKENPQKAFTCLKKAAAGEFSAAEFEIAKCYAKGDPIPKNTETAAEYLEKSLQHFAEGDRLSPPEFSRVKILRGTAQFYAGANPRKAVELLKKAEAAGDADAAAEIRKIEQKIPMQKSSAPYLKERGKAEGDDRVAESPTFEPERPKIPLQQTTAPKVQQPPFQQKTLQQSPAPQIQQGQFVKRNVTALTNPAGAEQIPQKPAVNYTNPALAKQAEDAQAIHQFAQKLCDMSRNLEAVAKKLESEGKSQLDAGLNSMRAVAGKLMDWNERITSEPDIRDRAKLMIAAKGDYSAGEQYLANVRMIPAGLVVIDEKVFVK